MRDQDKPFVLYRRGPMNFTIVPRGISGWAQFGLWMALLVPLVVWFDAYAASRGEGAPIDAGLALFLGAMLVWTVGGVWWMRARAEVVDVAEMLRLKREAERKPRR